MKFFDFKKKKAAEKGDDETRLDIKPYRDWRAIFSVFFGLLLVAIVVHVYVFLRVQAGTIFQASPEESTSGVELDVDLLNTVTAHFERKAERMQELLGTQLTP